MSTHETTLPVEGRLPGFDGAAGWLNSPPLTSHGLRGKVVLVQVTGTVAASRDVNNPDEGLLTIRVLIGGHVASNNSSTNLENDGVRDSTAVALAGAPVTQGRHRITIQGEECSTGVAFNR